MGLIVRAQEGFSIRLVREQSPNAGTVVGGVIGVLGGLPGVALGLAVGFAMESVSRHIDGRSAERLEANLKRLDPERVFTDRLLKELNDEPSLPPVSSFGAGNSAVAQGHVVDGLLTITIQQWGLRHCPSPDREEKVQAGLLYNGRISAFGKARPLWERDDLYLDGECYGLDQLDAKAGLLPMIVTRALENAAAKFVNEVRFP